MNASNPRLVLRNWVAQACIAAASAPSSPDYEPTRRVVELLRNPFDGEVDMRLTISPDAVAAAAAADAGGSGHGATACERAGRLVSAVDMDLDGPPPAWSLDLCVTCSS